MERAPKFAAEKNSEHSDSIDAKETALYLVSERLGMDPRDASPSERIAAVNETLKAVSQTVAGTSVPLNNEMRHTAEYLARWLRIETLLLAAEPLLKEHAELVS